SGSVMNAQLGIRLKAYGTLLKEDAFIGPYLTGTFGVARVSTDGNTPAAFDHSSYTRIGSAGAGLRFRFSDAVSAFVQTSWMATADDNVDGVDPDNWERYLQHNIGLGFNLGKAKDTD